MTPCEQQCAQHLGRLLQVQLALGRDRDRVRRVVWHVGDLPQLGDSELAAYALDDAAGRGMVAALGAERIGDGRVYVADPRGRRRLELSAGRRTKRTVARPQTVAGRIRLMNVLFVRLARVGAVLALTVVMLGAWVRLTDAGLGCPDWPGCYGRLVVPDAATTSPAELGARVHAARSRQGKAWREMIHRYLASTLGLDLRRARGRSRGAIAAIRSSRGERRSRSSRS